MLTVYLVFMFVVLCLSVLAVYLTPFYVAYRLDGLKSCCDCEKCS